MHENQSPVPLPRYRCHKVVEAAKIDSVTISLVGCDAPTAFREECRTTRWLQLVGVKEPVPVTAEWYDRHKVEPGGYFVRYADGYTSFSPAAAFEEGYAPVGAAATGTLATLAGNLIDDPKVEGAVKDMARWVLGTIEAISPGKSVHDDLDTLRRERDALRKECAEWRRMFNERFDADCQQMMGSPRPGYDSDALAEKLRLLRMDLYEGRSPEEAWASRTLFNVAGAIKQRVTEKSSRNMRDDLEAARRERDEVRQQLEKAKAGERGWVEALGLLTTLHPTMVIDVDDPVGMAKQIMAKVAKLHTEIAEQSMALFDVSLAVEKIDGCASSTLQNLAPRIKRLGDRLAHAEREAPPTVAESEGFLAVAHDPGMWSQAADEFFVRKRIYRDHCPTPWVGMLWRHGPGVSNLTAPDRPGMSPVVS